MMINFKSLPKLKNSKAVAFGMMRKSGKSSHNDSGLNQVLNSGVFCLSGGQVMGFSCENV